MRRRLLRALLRNLQLGDGSLSPNSYQRSDRFSLVFVVEVQATQARVRSLLISSMKVLLGMKKRGFGEDM